MSAARTAARRASILLGGAAAGYLVGRVWVAASAGATALGWTVWILAAHAVPCTRHG